MDIYAAVKAVEKIEEKIDLKIDERWIEGFRAFLGLEPEQYIEDLIAIKQINNELIKQSIEFLKTNTIFEKYIFQV